MVEPRLHGSVTALPLTMSGAGTHEVPEHLAGPWVEPVGPLDVTSDEARDQGERRTPAPRCTFHLTSNEAERYLDGRVAPAGTRWQGTSFEVARYLE